MNTQARLRAVAAAFIAVLMVSVFAMAPGASADTPPAPTCPDGLVLVNHTTCEGPATVTTVQANVECPAGYDYSAAVARCSGPGVYVPAVAQIGPRCTAASNAAAADLQAAHGGTVTAAIDAATGYCRLTLMKSTAVNCPKHAALLAGNINGGTGYCDYAAETIPAVSAMCNGAPTTGTAADCTDTEPVISITCKGANDVLTNDQCTTTTCAVGHLMGGVCTTGATIGHKPSTPQGAPAISVPSAGLAGPLVTTTTPSIAIPVQPSAPAAGGAQLAMTGPSSAQGVAVNAAMVLVGFGLVSLIWAAYFRERQAV